METTQPAAGIAVAEGTFEPRLTAFFCKWCTYAGADLAGTSRLTYPPNIRAIMLPCTGRIDIAFVLRAFLQGADGVLVSGCHPGDCHYTAGNFRARRRWILFRDLLDTIGFDLRRFECAWISAAEGQKFARTVAALTEKLKGLGPYREMRALAADRQPPLAPAAPPASAVASEPAAQPCEPLAQAAAEALTQGKVKAVAGWVRSATLGRPRLTFVTDAAEAKALAAPAGLPGNPARLLKGSKLRALQPLGIVARPAELRAVNVLCQEKQLDPAAWLVFGFDDQGKFLGALPWADALAKMLGGAASSGPAGFTPETWKQLDDLMAMPREKRWEFWRAQFERCVKCYACRQSCPLCGCDACLAEKNQPQWFPTAADGPGNVAWHITRAFHLAGRCVGCGSCESACPAGLPLNVLGAAMARSAHKRFQHVAGADPAQAPLQADYKPSDVEDFIL